MPRDDAVGTASGTNVAAASYKLLWSKAVFNRWVTHAPLGVFLLSDFWIRIRSVLSPDDHRIRAREARRSFNLGTESSSRLDDDWVGHRAGLGAKARCADGDSLIAIKSRHRFTRILADQSLTLLSGLRWADFRNRVAYQSSCAGKNSANRSS